MTTIRLGAPGDEERLAVLNRFVHDLHLEHRPDHFKKAQLPELTAWYAALLANGNTRCWIAENKGSPVGYVIAMFHHAPEDPLVQARAWCEIDQLAVDPAHRRGGIGRDLIRCAIAAAKAEGIERIEATSWSFNEAAHEVFRHLGFVEKTIRFELASH